MQRRKKEGKANPVVEVVNELLLTILFFLWRLWYRALAPFAFAAEAYEGCQGITAFFNPWQPLFRIPLSLAQLVFLYPLQEKGYKAQKGYMLLSLRSHYPFMPRAAFIPCAAKDNGCKEIRAGLISSFCARIIPFCASDQCLTHIKATWNTAEHGSVDTWKVENPSSQQKLQGM